MDQQPSCSLTSRYLSCLIPVGSNKYTQIPHNPPVPVESERTMVNQTLLAKLVEACVLVCTKFNRTEP